MTDPSSGTSIGSLRDKVALVTGASQGTGIDIAKHCALAGAQVAVHYRAAAREAEKVAGAIRDDGGVAEIFAADLARADDARRLADQVEARLGRVDVLVNNAGPFSDVAFTRLSEAEWDHVMSANLKAVFLLAQRLAPGMRAAGWGRIVSIGATSAFVRSHSVYGLAKAALLHLTESLAVELAPEITVNAVVPSQIASARTDTMPDYRDRAVAGTPLRRLVTQEEIARMVVAVCSPLFDFVTGRAIVMDGGRALPVFPKLHVSLDD